MIEKSFHRFNLGVDLLLEASDVKRGQDTIAQKGSKGHDTRLPIMCRSRHVITCRGGPHNDHVQNKGTHTLLPKQRCAIHIITCRIERTKAISLNQSFYIYTMNTVQI